MSYIASVGVRRVFGFASMWMMKCPTSLQNSVRRTSAAILYTRPIIQGPLKAPALTHRQLRFLRRNSNRNVERVSSFGRVGDGTTQAPRFLQRGGAVLAKACGWSVEANLLQRRVGARNPILQPSSRNTNFEGLGGLVRWDCADEVNTS
jgi:hypothetical protein